MKVQSADRALLPCSLNASAMSFLVAARDSAGTLRHRTLDMSVLIATGVFATVAGFPAWWAQLVPYTYVPDVAMTVLLPALAAGVICSTEGLRIAGRGATEVPRATTRAVQRSVTWLFAIFAFVTVLTYL